MRDEPGLSIGNVRLVRRRFDVSAHEPVQERTHDVLHRIVHVCGKCQQARGHDVRDRNGLQRKRGMYRVCGRTGMHAGERMSPWDAFMCDGRLRMYRSRYIARKWDTVRYDEQSLLQRWALYLLYARPLGMHIQSQSLQSWDDVLLNRIVGLCG